MTHDATVQAFLAVLAEQATDTGYLVLTDDLAKALDTAAWKIEQHNHPDAETRRAYESDKHYRYGR